MRRAVVVLSVLVLALGGCGDAADDTAPAATTLDPRTATTTADGLVPWLAEELPSSAVALEPPELPPFDEDAPLCEAAQLEVLSFEWFTKGDTDDGSDDPARGIFARLVVRNGSQQECRLAGQPTVAVTWPAGRIESTPGGINDEAEERQVAMPSDEPADLRIDWSPPVCDVDPAGQAVLVDLGDGRGMLEVPVAEPAVPNCLRGDAAEGLASHLQTSTFEAGRHATLPTEPLATSALVAALSDQAVTADGSAVTYVISLTNPTAVAIVLDPCPAYVQTLLQVGDAEHDAVSGHRLQRLNCVPEPALDPGKTVRFEMRMPIDPSTPLAPAADVTLSWALFDPAVDAVPPHATVTFRPAR